MRLLKVLSGLLIGVSALAVAPGARTADGQDWPQWRGARRDGIWRETGLTEKLPAEIPIKWRAPIANGYSSPTVAGGRVYVTDRVTEPASAERIHCFAADTGKALWTHSYPSDYKGLSYPNGPRAAVTVHDGRAYALGAVGHFTCLEAASGKVLWAHDLAARYAIRMPDWGTAAAPLIEGDLVVLQIGGEGACVVALDRKTGVERWKALSDKASYAPPVALERGGRRIVLVWTADRLVGLAATDGKLLWEVPFPTARWPIAIADPVVEGDFVFLASAIDGSQLIRLKPDGLGAERVWLRRGPNDATTDALHSLMSTPYFLPGGKRIIGVDINGELRCLDAQTGDRLWESLEAVPRTRWANIHLVRNGDRTWLFNERGQLILARITEKGYEELTRGQLLKPTRGQLNQRGGVCWSHPAFAYRAVFARNDEELVCADLSR